jgi:hypothetical protein
MSHKSDDYTDFFAKYGDMTTTTTTTNITLEEIKGDTVNHERKGASVQKPKSKEYNF